MFLARFAFILLAATSCPTDAPTDAPKDKPVTLQSLAASPQVQLPPQTYIQRTRSDGERTLFVIPQATATCAPDPQTDPSAFAYFESASRFSNDPTALPTNTVIQYNWDLVGAGDVVVYAGPVGNVTAPWKVPSWGVPKCAVVPGSRVRLKLTAVGAAAKTAAQ